MRKKLKDSRGLTLVEMLCAVLILVLLCLLMNTGLQMAMTTYRAITSASETQLLLNSLANALADKLRFTAVSKDAAGNYTCSVGVVEVTDGRVTVGGEPLLPDGAYRILPDGTRAYVAEKAAVTPSAVGSDIIFTVELGVKEKSGDIGAGTVLAVRCLNPPKETP